VMALGNDRWRRAGIASTLACTIVAGATSAHAWSKQCMWPHTGYTEVPVRVNCESFAAHGVECPVAREAVAMGAKPWNTTGGSFLRFKYPVSTANWSPAAGEVLVSMAVQETDPSVLATSQLGCDGRSHIRLLASHFYAPGIVFHIPSHSPYGGLPDETYPIDLVGLIAKQLGHALGLRNSYDPPGNCGGVAHSEQALMGDRWDTRSLFRDDYDALWAGNTSCAYVKAPPPDTSRTLRLLVAGSAAGPWTQLHEWSWWSSSGNLSPGMAQVPGGLLVAIPNNTNGVQLWRWNGTMTHVAFMDTALAGPTIAYGGGVYLVAFPLLTNAPVTGTMRVWRSTDGMSWTPYQPVIHTGTRPAIAWHEGHQRFYMAVTEHSGPLSDGYSPHRVALYYSISGDWWVGPFHADTTDAPANRYTADLASAGPGLVCPPTQNDCWLIYPDARTYTGTLRVRRIRPCLGLWDPFDPECGTPGQLVGKSFLPPWNLAPWDGHWSTSRHDVEAAYDPSLGDVVVGFHGGNPSGAGRVALLGTSDTSPPPGFHAGDTAMNDMHGGMALAVEPYFGGHITYALGHAAPLD
jgi:hypothetical protein